MSVRDLYLMAESLRMQGRPARQIRQHLVSCAKDAGLGEVSEIRKGERFEVRVGEDGKIIFDGAKFFYQGR